MKDNEDLIKFLQKRNNNIISTQKIIIRFYKTRFAKDFNEFRKSFIARFEIFDNKKLININNEKKVFMHKNMLTKIKQKIINFESQLFINKFKLNIKTNAKTFFTMNEFIY